LAAKREKIEKQKNLPKENPPSFKATPVPDFVKKTIEDTEKEVYLSLYLSISIYLSLSHPHSLTRLLTLSHTPSLIFLSA
jgi:hypothetical protein